LVSIQANEEDFRRCESILSFKSRFHSIPVSDLLAETIPNVIAVLTIVGGFAAVNYLFAKQTDARIAHLEELTKNMNRDQNKGND